MSTKKYKEYIAYNMVCKPYKNDKYLIMIYKPNDNKEEKKAKIELLKEQYPLDNDAIRLFGKYFVRLNKHKYKIIYNNKMYELKEYFDEIDSNYNQKIKEIKLKLIGVNIVTNMKKMFYGCVHLTSVSYSKNINIQKYISKIMEFKNEINSNGGNINNSNTNNELNEGHKESFDFYYGLKSSYNDKISSINSNNDLKFGESLDLDFNNIIENILLSSSNFIKIKNISCMFEGCISLKSLPDISK